MSIPAASLARPWRRPSWAVIKQARQRQRRRRLRLMAVLGAAALAAGGWGLGRDHPAGPRSAAAVPPAAIVAADTKLDGTPIAAAATSSALWVLTCIRNCSAGQRSSGVAAGGGLVWAYGSYFNPAASSPGDHDAGVVVAIDPRTGTIVRQLRVGGPDDSFGYGNGAFYVADFEQGLVVRISPDLTVQTLHATPGAESLVAASSGALWATTETGRLLRIVSRP